MGKTIGFNLSELRGTTAPPSRTALIEPEFIPRSQELIEVLLNSDRPFESFVSSELFAEQSDRVGEEINALMNSMADLDLGAQRRWLVDLAQAIDRPAPDPDDLQRRFFSEIFALLSDRSRGLSEPVADLLLEASQEIGNGRKLALMDRANDLHAKLRVQLPRPAPSSAERMALTSTLLTLMRFESGQRYLALDLALQCSRHFDGLEEEIAYELVGAFRSAF